MKTKISFLLLFTFFLIVFLTFYLGLQKSNIYKPSLNIEKDIPLYKVRTLESSDKINSEEVFEDDRFYLLNIWASWCLPCRDEHEFLIDLSKQKNFEIIGLNYKDNINNAKKFLKELDSPYKIVFLDKDGTIAIEWGAYGVPENFLIYDRKIIKKIIGPIDQASFIEIKKIIQ